ncbi:hypothetical protein QYF61_021825 [Mycteria americana]|uniref:Uncharacterized protein n=1 Tax=Mycteria americana TaxID=33587 RepID=A0AAN7S0J8_MYCAM|nr:hypothetical protein QYF61_021825 [Mycteria americana]
MLDNPLGEEKFPNIQSKPPLAQLEAISSRPITCYLGEETDPHLSTPSFQVVEESDEVSPQPPFLQAKQSQLPQPLLIRLLLQTLHQLRCPSLHTLQHLNVSLVVGGPKLNTAFEVRPHQCRVQGHDHCPSPAGHTIFDTSQDAIGFLGRLGTLLAHIQAAVNQHPQVLLCQAAFQPLFPKPVALHGVAVAQVQDLALGLVKPHTIDLGPSTQPVQVPLQSLPTLKQINTPTQLGVICKLTEAALDPFVQIIDKDVKQNWPQHRALGNTTSCASTQWQEKVQLSPGQCGRCEQLLNKAYRNPWKVLNTRPKALSKAAKVLPRHCPRAPATLGEPLDRAAGGRGVPLVRARRRPGARSSRRTHRQTFRALANPSDDSSSASNGVFASQGSTV